jgi:nucleoside-diphosphate-sugar epimerase/predicted dehydrogenase
MTLRAGLVGAGNIGRFHVQALRRLANVEIVGVTDVDSERARHFAREMGIAPFGSLKELASAGAQVIHVLTPPATHAAVAIEAIALGCDVFVEKPLATSAEDCDAIHRAAEEHGRTVCAGHSLLYDPFVRGALHLARHGAVGDILAFDYFRAQNPQTYQAAAVTGEQRRGGYPFRDVGIHALYLAEAFVGAVTSVNAWPEATGRGDCNLWIDEWRVVAECERGSAHIHLSWNVAPQQSLIVIHGTRGIIRADLSGMSVVVKKQRRLPEHATRVVNSVSEGISTAAQAMANVARVATGHLWQFHGIQALVGEFYRRLAAGQPSPVPAADARRAVRWTEEIARRADRMKDAWVAARTVNRAGARTLVTGGSGFIGGNLVQRLLERGTPVRLLLRREPPAELAANPLVEIVIGDLADRDAVAKAVNGVDTVYHLGAAMRGDARQFERGTVDGTRNVVESCIAHNVRRLVHMSSLAVIDAEAGRSGEPITETSPLETLAGERGNYTRAKLEAEAIVTQAAASQGLPAIILRPGEVVGPEKPLLTPGVAQRIGRNLVVLGNGSVRLPLVHVSDVVDGLLAAATADVRNGTIVQLVEGTGVTQNDIVAHYLATSGERCRVWRVPLPAVLVLATLVEVFAIRVLGWAPVGRRRIRAAAASREFDCERAKRTLGWMPRKGVSSAFGGALRHPASTTARPEPAVGPAVG